ncbi:MAG: hypothetical protein ACD_8C00110G0001 [uncultured bacterium]|nr:MAG: hypothetical protein ACD_8C00110G0001 [uncultured bacterium]
MFFHFQILLYSLVFYFFLQFVTGDFVSDWLLSIVDGWSWSMAFFLSFSFFGFFQIAKNVSRKLWMTPIPVLLTISTTGLLYFVQSIKQQQLLILLAGIAYYFLHIALYRLRTCETDKTARGIISAGSVSTIFLFYAMSYGIYLNFAIPLWILMGMLMIVTVLVSLQYLWLINNDSKIVLNYSLVLGFVMAEIIWILNFWPFGYLTTGVISLIFYYVFWDLVQRHFLSELSKRRVVANVIIFGLLTALVLSSTRWLPVV